MIALALLALGLALAVLAVLALRPDHTKRICDEYRRDHGGGPFPGGDSRG